MSKEHGRRRAIDICMRSASSHPVRYATRNDLMRELLITLRDKESLKLRALLHDDTVQAVPTPGDELDQARPDEDLEIRVTLLDLSESRLSAITSALVRLEEGRFGLCEECDDEISITRLNSVPFARSCFDCQKEIEKASRRQCLRVVSDARQTSLFDPYQPKVEDFGPAEDSDASMSSSSAVRRRRR